MGGKRRSIRLKGYDYSQAGRYYVTLCAQDYVCRFGSVVSDQMRVNPAGLMVDAVWCSLPERFATVMLDYYVIMPNHFHGILFLLETGTDAERKDLRQFVGAGLVPAHVVPDRETAAEWMIPKSTSVQTIVDLGEIVGAFKSLSTHAYARQVRERGWRPFRKRLWQRNYYEHVIRNRADLRRIREYIQYNPNRWADDPENPVNRST